MLNYVCFGALAHLVLIGKGAMLLQALGEQWPFCFKDSLYVSQPQFHAAQEQKI